MSIWNHNLDNSLKTHIFRINSSFIMFIALLAIQITQIYPNNAQKEYTTSHHYNMYVSVNLHFYKILLTLILIF